MELTFYVFSRILNLQIHAHIYRSFIRHHKMLGVRIAKRKIEPQKPANHCDTRLCSCIFSVNTRQKVTENLMFSVTFYFENFSLFERTSLGQCLWETIFDGNKNRNCWHWEPGLHLYCEDAFDTLKKQH